MKKARIQKSMVSVLLLLAILFVAACNSASKNGNETDRPTQSAAPSSSNTSTPSSPGTSSPGTAPSQSPADGEPKYGGILKIVTQSEGSRPIGVPWECTGMDSNLIIPLIETLLRESTKGELAPCLAESWEFFDTEMVFKLREDVYFHDGTHFDAEAAAWNITKSLEAKILSGILYAEVRDEYVLALVVEKFQNNVLNRLASRSYSGMISPTAFEENGIEWARENPVATGPFTFESYVRGDTLKYTRNENYWQDGKPYLDGIWYPFIRDEATQQMALLTEGDQGIDVLNTTSGELTFTLSQNPILKSDLMPIGPISLVPSSLDESSPLALLEVRQAISYAIDRDALMAARGFGVLTAARQYIPDTWDAYLPTSYDCTYNPDKAKELLSQAGYPEGFKTKLFTMPGMVDKDIVVAMQGMLKDVGIECEIEFPDSGGYTSYRSTGWDGLLVQHMRTSTNPAVNCHVYWVRPEQFVSCKRPDGLIDTVMEALYAHTPDTEKNQAIHKILMDNMVVIPIYNCNDAFVQKAYVMDGEFAQWGTLTFFLPYNIWLDK